MSKNVILTAGQKALQINLDNTIYGSFVEIGAGQEVARNFFKAGSASTTIAKTMSAYDRNFSDAIYGKEKSIYMEIHNYSGIDWSVIYIFIL